MSFRILRICFFVIFVLVPSVVSSETVTIVADEWPPFNSIPNSSEEGFLVDVARAVFEPKGITISYKLMPWRRAVEMTRAGQYNGLIGASKTDAPDFIFPSEELSRNVISFYVRKGSTWRFHDRKDIENVSIGIIDGYDYRKWFLDYISLNRGTPDKIQIMTGNEPLRRNILKLLDKRVDAIVDNEAVILYVARKMGVHDQIIPAGRDHEPAYIYIAFSPKREDSKRYAEILSNGIMRLRKSGQLTRILSQYGLRDWK